MDQVEEHLLKLYSIAPHSGQLGGEGRYSDDSASDEIVMYEFERLQHNFVENERLTSQSGFREQSSQVLYYFPAPGGVGRDVGENLLQFAEVAPFLLQYETGCAGVAEDCRERLVQFVSHRAGELAKRRDAREMRQFLAPKRNLAFSSSSSGVL
jgi:hypothetical protein